MFDYNSVRIFLRYVQKVQVLFVTASQNGGVTKGDADRCARAIYDQVVIRDKIYL